MANEKKHSVIPGKGENFRIEGNVQRDQQNHQPGELRLSACIFDQAGTLLGSADIDSKGNYTLSFRMPQTTDVDLVVGPMGDAQQLRHSSAYREKIAASAWKKDGRQHTVSKTTVLPLEIWRPWWPQRICISGHVRKIRNDGGCTDSCPVPFVKVEIFDVDRGPCLWPWFRKWWEILLDRPVIRIPDLLREPRVPPRPFPGPDPVPEMSLGQKTDWDDGGRVSKIDRVAINPQPEPPGADPLQQQTFLRVGESRLMDNSIAARLDKLTLTSKIAPWRIFPRCFYSRMEICETTTDCNGYFNCCFKWWPLHFRRGRLRYDSRPDIIIRVTQVIDGVATVVYLDPYTSTRWNVTSTHIDLYLDNEDVVCGSWDCGERPEGSEVFFTRIGDDEVDKIDAGSGLYNSAPFAHVAYGGSLLIHGQFGDALSAGSPARYYRLSYARQGSSDFIPITAALDDHRVEKGTWLKETHALGPKTVNGQPALYEVRNCADYYWFNPDWLGTWHTWLAEEDTGKYTLRLELFDENGQKLTSSMGINYLNGAIAAPGVLTAAIDQCDLILTLDNKAPEVDLVIPAVMGDCGIVPEDAVPPLNLLTSVSQENGRLYSWGLQYTKGVSTGPPVALDGATSPAGTVTPVHKVIDAAAAPTGVDILAGLTTSCAFALKLWAWPHIRNGRNFIYYREQIKAIAVEKSPLSP